MFYWNFLGGEQRRAAGGSVQGRRKNLRMTKDKRPVEKEFRRAGPCYHVWVKATF